MSPITKAAINSSFIRSGGELGELIQTKDWSKTALGSPSTWPPILHTLLGVILENPLGMFIYWGKDYTQLYNDGFRSILGITKHPASLGISASETFAEIWEILEPILADVMQGNSVRIPDFEVQMNRHGYLESCCFDFSCSPIRLENGEVAGLLGTVLEITEQKKAEKALQESKDKLKFAIDAAELGTWEFNPLNNKFTANEQLKEWFGLSANDEIKLHHAINVIAEEDRARVNSAIQKTLNYNSGEIFQEQCRIIHPGTKKEIIVRAKGKAWFDDEKKAYRFNGTLEDVTSTLIAQQKAKETEIFNKTILESSPDCVKVLDLNGAITFINLNGVCLLEGKNKAFFLNRYWLTFWDDETKPAIENAIDQALQGRNSHFIAKAAAVKGTPKWWDVIVTPILDSRGKIVSVLATSRDVTEQKELIEKLKSSVDQLRLYEKVVANTNDAILISEVNPLDFQDSKILHINAALCQQTGYTAEEVVGNTSRMFHGPATDKKGLEKIQKALKEKAPVKVELVNYKKNGEEIIVQIENIPLLDEIGTLTHYVSVQKDVTEKVTANKKIEESELRFRQLADQAPMWVWMADENVNVLYANHQLLDFIGIADVSQFTGHVWEQMVHRDHIQLVYKAFGEASKSQEGFSFEFKVKHAATKQYEWFYIKAVPRFESGKFAGFIGTALNIEEQRATLSLLEYRTALLEAFNESSNDGILLVDTKGSIISYNRCFVEIWDMPEHIVDAKDDKAALDFAMTQLESPEKFMDTIKMLYSHPDQKSKDELHFKNGKIIERHGFPVIAQDGGFYAWSWTFRDITDLKKTSAALKESEETFRKLSELMPEKVSRTDGEGNVKYFNQSWLDYTGLSFEEIQDWGWEKVVHPDDKEELSLKWAKSLATGQNFEMEFRLLSRNGEFRWHLCRSNPLRDETGKINNWLAAVTEIQKIKEEEQRKGDFIKMVSHELKTPVTSIKGYVQLLLSMLYSDQDINISSIPFKPTLERVDKQVSRLTRLITEMLDLSRLEESKLELEKETFNLNTLVTETIQDLQHTNSSHHISFIQNFEASISGDRDRIQQVLINFINNAIKYSPDKKLVKVTLEESKNNQVVISVKDFGIGINKIDQEKVFERFYRVSGKKETTFSGFGIGLYIAKEIIERHQGTISVESKIGQGATFSFGLPIVK
ncbi:PAS domain S-box protein [Algoriphagus sp.]|uniref:PAS domain S-box protein n=1 Tax=Algoriphagus sp. TaxID=1872435 RepID=UPI00271A1D66|nr:PAS domain S-box protein [Algoriphagus sp.]MDO8965042.1 PAS domain S-box protein [Algoriphagus sp.]MDP3201851.1 PAS domain S-box protein [Algoriphagus sp.]